MDNTSFPVLVPQTFRGVNLGGLFVPAGGQVHEGPAQMAALLAAPFQGPMHVHAVPVMFGHVQTTSRPQSPAGLSTPGGGVNV